MRKDIFSHTRRATCTRLSDLVPTMLPLGRRIGGYWLALNPTRPDRRLGSFRINLKTGVWADFATGDKGGDIVSLASYLYGIGDFEAAQYILRLAGVAPNGR